jgi:hypothetical protein
MLFAKLYYYMQKKKVYEGKTASAATFMGYLKVYGINGIWRQGGQQR